MNNLLSHSIFDFLFSDRSADDGSETILRSTRESADKFVLFALWAHLPFASIIIPYGYGTWKEGVISSLVISVIGTISYLISKGTLAHRLLNGLLLLSYPIIFISLQYGRIEMHFHVFSIFPVLLLYKDWRIFPMPILLIAAHHAVFNYCQINGIELFGFPLIVFNYGNGWDIVLLHSLFVLFETSFLMYFASTFKEQHLIIARSNDYLSQTVERIKKEINTQHTVLVNSSKLSALGEMAGNIAHEINNPLTIINGSSILIDKAMKNEKIDHEKIKNHLNDINKTVLRITNIVNGLRKLSRSEKLDEISSHSLRECLEDVVLLFGAKLKNRGIELKFDLLDK